MRRKIGKFGIIIPIFAVLLAAFFALGASPPGVIDSGTCGTDLRWTLTDDGILTITGAGPMDDFDEGDPPPWSSRSGVITHAVIDAGVTSIGIEAFYGHSSLRSIEISESVKSVGALAFSTSGLTSVTFPDSVISIGENVITGCRDLHTVIFGNGVDNLSFHNTLLVMSGVLDSLQNIVVGTGVTEIGGSSIGLRCPKLESVTFAEGSQLKIIGEQTFSNARLLQSIDIPASVTTIGESAFSGCDSLESVTFAEGSSLKTIGDSAFRNTAQTSIIIPDTVTSIGSLAFRDTGLTSITIPDSVESIGVQAFLNCQSLESVTLPDNPSFVTIFSGTFERCESLTNINIPDTVTTIDDWAFLYCESLTNIDIPDSVEYIGEWAFGNSGLTSVTIPDSVTTIGQQAFESCQSLESVTFGSDSQLETIGYRAFTNSSLRNINIPDSVKTIGGQAFSFCQSLESVTLPDNLDFIIIEYSTFVDCTSLTSITIPNTVTTIGFAAFADSGLTSIVIPNSVQSIGDGVFSGGESLTSVVIGTGVTVIPDNAFQNCTELQHVLIPGMRPSFDIFTDAFLDANSDALIWAPFGSVALEAADNNGLRTAYLPNLGEVSVMHENVDGVLYQYLPYEYVTKTEEVPNNHGLEFSITPALPAGLSLADGGAADTSGLIPGTIYGAAVTVSPDVTYTLTAWPRGLTPDIYNGRAVFNFEIKPLSEHPELNDNNSFSTKYELVHDPGGDDDNDGHIGVYNTETERYEITGHINDVLGNQILYIDRADVSRFAGLWIDGIEMTRGTSPSNGDYRADRGSTRVTIFEQTIKELENGEHVAVAAFYTVDPQTGEYTRAAWENFEEGNQLDIVAQKFYVNLEGRENGGGGEEPGGGDNTGDDNTGNDNTGGDNTVNNDPGNYDSGTYDYGNYDYGSVDRGQDTGDRGQETGGTTPGGTAPDGTAPGGTAPGGTAPGGTAPDGTAPGGTTPGGTAPDGTAPGGAAPGGTAPGGTAPGGTTPGGTAPGGTAPGGTAPDGTTPDGTAPSGTAPGGQGIADQVRNDDGSTTSGGTTPTGTAFSGLPVGPDGNFYFDLDGSGNPMVLRIDIPFEEFEELRMNGQTWIQGTDYTAASGSTVITIGAYRLDRLDAGTHTLAAVFESETVEIVFTLNKAGPAGASPSVPGGAASSAIGGGAGDITAPAQNGGALPFIIAGAAVVATAAAVTLIVRKKRA